MKNAIGRRVAVVGAIVSAVVFLPLIAWAAEDSTATSVVGDGALTLKDTLVSIATTVLPYAAAILAIVFGWRLARRFIGAGR